MKIVDCVLGNQIKGSPTVQTSYAHTQRSYLILVILAAVFLSIATSSMPEPIWTKAVVFGAGALVLALGYAYSSLTVMVDDKTLTWHFGLGFWKNKIARSDITDAQPVTTKWWHGWGIRWTPDGWLYNVAGFDAVAVTTQDGKTVMIGTDEPDALVAALGF